MLPLASYFGGPYGLFFGCAALILIPFFGVAWIWLQVRALLISERLSPLMLALVVSFSLVPAFIVITSMPGLRAADGFGKFLFFLSLSGIILILLTLTREFFKYLRDRPRPSRRRPPAARKRDQSDETTREA